MNNSNPAINLLIVEDNQDDVVIITENLRLQGINFNFKAVDTPHEYEKEMLTRKYDVILCDHKMPRFNSLDALEIMHKNEEDIPFIIVSGVIGEDIAVEAMRLGAHDYIMKQNLKRLRVAIEREIREGIKRKEILQIANELKESEKRFKALAEKLAEAVKARDQFIAIASHEFNTPIATLLLQMELSLKLLQRDEKSFLKPESLRKIFELSIRNIKTLAKLVDNLLSLTLINTSKIKITITPHTDLNVLTQKIIDKMTTEIHPTADFKTFLKLHLAKRPIWVDVDVERIEQVINNLISNAFKYGDRKDIEIDLATVDAKWAEIRCKNYGVGISPDDQQKIFEPFQRKVSNANVTGLGLGLFICRKIIESHGGFLNVESNPNQQTTFVARIPLST